MGTPVEILTHLARTMGFLSRIPMPAAAFKNDDGKVSKLAHYFPIAGLLLGLAPALVFSILLALHTDALMAALIALLVLTLQTGALHEDGLADVADGIGGGSSREKRLAIMKDSRIGTYGALALILSLALRAAALAAIARETFPFLAAAAFPAAACLSRAALVWHWQRLPAAKPEGVAASVGQPDEKSLHAGLLSACLLAAFLLWPSLGLQALVSSVITVGIVAIVFTRYIRARLSGHTGDTLGACQQICETACLCALAMSV
ncbi:adenosylcobinamide-GDP ribazoletransferase [Oryzifoliimicrobium ureilyticus]|uniref:adenosylcobinamide-GDP ribazoletransferase n=1 Tax=Oryzifoliimicrobium ureilyticus TaxID=3113724 RepID=UPI003076731A